MVARPRHPHRTPAQYRTVMVLKTDGGAPGV
jgi:hypothetical protein